MTRTSGEYEASLVINGIEVDRLGHGLGHDDTVERVAMVHRQIGDSRRGLPVQGKFDESRRYRRCSYLVRSRGEVGSAEARLYRDLPNADWAEHNLIAGILD